MLNNTSYRQRYSNRLAARKLATCTYQSLEPKQLLAAMLYVDFGVGTGDLNINDVQSLSVGGPQIFGGGHSLESLSTTINDAQIDLNFDSAFNAGDFDEFYAQVVDNLNGIFEVFDVTVARVDSSNIGEIGSKLNERSTNDAYIFVGGTSPIGTEFEFGSAIIDSGNAIDNLGFVFAKDVFDFWIDGLGNANAQRYELAPQLSWAVARNVAKQAGHSFGLQSTEATQGQAGFDVMRMVGTDQAGNALPYEPAAERRMKDGNPGAFSRFAHAVTTVDGSVPGTQNSYQALVSAVGMKANAPYYVTSFGSSVQNIQISSTAAGSLTIQIGNQTFEPTVAELANGLLVDGNYRLDSTSMPNSFVGPEVTMGKLANHRVEINNVASIKMDQSLDHDFSGQPSRDSFRSRLEILPVIGANYFGEINTNISYNNVLRLSSGGASDAYHFFSTINDSRIEQTDGLFHVADALSRDVITAGDGNNILTIARPIYLIRAGNGNDVFGVNRFGNGSAFEIQAGGGFDIFRTNRNIVHTNISSIVNIDGKNEFAGSISESKTSGIDRIVALNAGSTTINFFNLAINDPFTWHQVRDQTVVVDPITGARLEYIGTGQRFLGGRANDVVYIRSTENPLIVQGRYVQISSDFDPTKGNVSGINNDITYRSVGNNRLVISDQAGTGLTSGIYKTLIANINGRTINFPTQMPAITVFGSDLASDYIAVASSTAHVSLFGNGGNDIFTVGHSNSADPVLDDVKGNTTVDGGPGNDILLIKDSIASDLKITNRYVFKEAIVGLPTPQFGILRYDGFENLRARIISQPRAGKPFYTTTIWGSRQTRFFYDATSRAESLEAQPKTAEMVLIGGNPHDLRSFRAKLEPRSEPVNIRGGIWSFSIFDDREPINISRINRVFEA